MGRRGRFDVRVSEKDLNNIEKIRQCGDFSNQSATVRFCIHFTKTMLGILPAALAENYIKSVQEIEEPGPDVDVIPGPERIDRIDEPVCLSHCGTTCACE